MKFLTTLCLALFTMAAPAMAQTYYGGWKYDGNVLILGDSSDGTGLVLYNSPRYCGQTASRGSASIRAMLARSKVVDGGYINWYIDQNCNDGYSRICITTSLGESGCNTYRFGRWVDIPL